jgi:hypothetical protein
MAFNSGVRWAFLPPAVGPGWTMVLWTIALFVVVEVAASPNRRPRSRAFRTARSDRNGTRLRVVRNELTRLPTSGRTISSLPLVVAV